MWKGEEGEERNMSLVEKFRERTRLGHTFGGSGSEGVPSFGVTRPV